MRKKKHVNWARSVVGSLSVASTLLVGNIALADSSTSASSTVQSGNYDLSNPGTILVYKNETSQGGMNLATDSMTTNPKLTDIAINGNTIGAASIIDLGQVDFNSVTTAPTSGYSYEMSVTPNDVYVISTHDNCFAKLQVKMITASNVLFQYAYLQTNSGSNQPAQTSYTFYKGDAVVLTWPAGSRAKSYDILRSDNGGNYVKMTDFKLTAPTFTDNNCLVNHIYLYKYISYDASGNPIAQSDPIQITIVPKSSTNQSTAVTLVMQIDSNTVLVNGNTEQIDPAPTIVDGRTLVPLRFIGEALGAQVGWDDAQQKVTLTLGSHTIQLWINQHGALVDGQQVTLDVPPQVVDDHTLVPLRFVSESLNLNVNFDDATNTVTITGNAPTSGGSNPNPPSSQDLSYFFHTWNMYVPGSVDPAKGVVTNLGSSAGVLTINSDGTYQHVGGLDAGKGTWVKTGDANYPILLTDSATGNQWKVGQAPSPYTGQIVKWDGFVYEYGTVK